MSEITQSEKETDQIQPPFELESQEDESSGNWLQRVLYQPLEGFNVQNVKAKLVIIEEQRNRSKAGECILARLQPPLILNFVRRTGTGRVSTTRTILTY
jgi:hypothetical protein